MSHQSPTIAIPKKQTGDVDWPAPLRQIIATSYGENPDNYADECASLQRSRQDAVRGAGSDLTARDLLYKYFGQLELLELRFPDIKVPFPWHDAFTDTVTTQTSLAFEKASILFLLASTLSSLSASSTRTSPEGLKRAYHYARSSAGILVYINENFLHAPSIDLSKEVVKFLVNLTLAQAQEMFVEKVIEEGKGKERKKGPASGEGMIARLAAQAALMFAALGEEVKEFFGKGIIDKNWVSVINIKAKYFQSLSQHHRSLYDASTAAHGASLVRLTLSENLAREANRFAIAFTATFFPIPLPSAASTPTLPSDSATALLEITKAHLALVTEAKNQANRDNDLIYHAILPSEAALPVIEKLEVAKAIPIQEIYKGEEVARLLGPDADIFRRLIPLSVHEGASVYSEEKAKVGRQESDKSEGAELEIRAGLDSLGLPGALAKFRKLLEGGGLDALSEPSREAEGWAREIQEKERGRDSAGAMLKTLGEAKSRVENDLKAIQEQLDGEARECESARAKATGHFPQAPSATLTKNYRSDLRSQQSALSSAAQSDARVQALQQNIGPSIAVLSSSSALRRAYEEAVRGGAVGGGGGGSLLDLGVEEEEKAEGEKEEIKKVLGQVEDRLGRLNRLKRERGESLKDLKEHLRTDDVSQLLLLNRNRPQASTGQSTQSVDPALFTTELEKFRPYQNRLATAIEHEQTTLGELARLMETLSGARGGRDGRGEMVRKWEGAQRRVKELEESLGEAVVDWKEVQGGLKRGLEFYNQIQPMTDSLRQSVRSFVTSRSDERSRLLSSSSNPTSPATSSYAPPPPRLPQSQSAANGLERQMSGMSLGGMSSPPPLPPPSNNYPSYGQQQQQASSAYASSPYPPPPSSSASFPPPPPPQPPKGSGDPWDFGSLGSFPSAFQTSSPPVPPSAPAPPQHSPYGQQPSYPSYPGQNQQPQRESSYPALPPPPSNPQYSSHQTSYPYPQPPPPSSQYAPPPPSSSYPAPPPPSSHYQPPPTTSAYYPPPPSKSPYGVPPPPHSPYGAPPPPPQQNNGQQAYYPYHQQQQPPYGR